MPDILQIFRSPIDFDKLSIRFINCHVQDSCTMVINLENIFHEICPEYPMVEGVPSIWMDLSGEYTTAKRLSCNGIGEVMRRKFSIVIKDKILTVSPPFGPIVPVYEDYIIISRGPFAGETMEFYPETGHIIHQNAIFIPADQN